MGVFLIQIFVRNVKVLSQHYVIQMSSASVNNESSRISWICVNQHIRSNSASISFYCKLCAHSSPVDTLQRWGRHFSTISFPETRMFILSSFLYVSVYNLGHGQCLNSWSKLKKEIKKKKSQEKDLKFDSIIKIALFFCTESICKNGPDLYAYIHIPVYSLSWQICYNGNLKHALK